jgi:phage portal protein BeeE
MNEKIKKLIKESGTDVSGKWLSLDHVGNLHELTIKECIQTLINNGYDDAAQCLHDVHFGITDAV